MAFLLTTGQQRWYGLPVFKFQTRSCQGTDRPGLLFQATSMTGPGVENRGRNQIRGFQVKEG